MQDILLDTPYCVIIIMEYNYVQRDNEELNYRGEQVVQSKPSVEHAPAFCSVHNILY